MDNRTGTMWRSRWGRVSLSLLASLFIACNWQAPAAAQSSGDAAEERQSLSIPPGSLTEALNRLAAQGGLQILFDAAMTAGKQTEGVEGAFTPAEALDILLAGSGLSARFADARQVVLGREGSFADSADAEQTEVAALGPIKVYGARTTTTLEDVSASVGVVTAEEIEGGQIRYLQESFRRLANVMDGAFVNSGFLIRGMNTEGFVPAGAPMGSVYIDGILQARYSARFGARNLIDAEQVEIYRGPQSTLSGRAATAGAVYIKTKDPVMVPEGWISGLLGNESLSGVGFMGNAPLVEDQVAFRFSGSLEEGDTSVTYPTYQDYANYDKFRKEISRNLRAKVLVEPKHLPDTRALLSYSYSADRPNERLVWEGSDYTLDDERGDGYQFPTYAEFREIKVHNTGLELTHALSDTLMVTSQTGLNYGETKRRSVDVGTAGSVNGLAGTVDDTLLSQEFRLNYDQDRWSGVAGVFGSFQEFDSVFDAALDPYLELAQTFNRKTTNVAAFGEVTYEFYPTWKATLGGRLDYLREKTVQTDLDTYPYGGTPVASENSAVFDEINAVPKLGLSKDLAPGHVAGATYSEGFRTGGFYVNNLSRKAEYYGPESARNFELFYKGRFLDNRLSVNANLFLTKYEDQQVEIRPDPNDQTYRETTNAASSQAWGFELEPTFQVDEQLSVFAAIGYLNTEFEEFNHASYGDLSGEPFPEAPEWTIGFGSRYEFENGFYVGGDAKYTSGYLADFGISPTDDIDARFIVNAQAGFKKDNWEINAFAENLLDERYYTFIDRDAAPVYAQIGPRLSFGLNAKVKF
ncbi:TonB-dependent receptor [Nisaea sp.]|uniref:TonB-dependent receptor n=1 Tax=Nisaea sp. TaxID=2024842 RepID=UPI0032972791